eukprot:RCo005113
MGCAASTSGYASSEAYWQGLKKQVRAFVYSPAQLQTASQHDMVVVDSLDGVVCVYLPRVGVYLPRGVTTESSLASLREILVRDLDSGDIPNHFRFGYVYRHRGQVLHCHISTKEESSLRISTILPEMPASRISPPALSSSVVASLVLPCPTRDVRTVIGTVGEVLGYGSTAIVRGLSRPDLCVKTFPMEYVHAKMGPASILSEVAITHRLGCNAAQIYGVFEDRGTEIPRGLEHGIHFVMERGACDLHDLIAVYRPLDPVYATKLLLHVLRLIKAAHDADVALRDVKPENFVLFLPEGTRMARIFKPKVSRHRDSRAAGDSERRCSPPPGDSESDNGLCQTQPRYRAALEVSPADEATKAKVIRRAPAVLPDVDTLKLKIVDLGMASLCNGQGEKAVFSELSGSLGFLSPEVLIRSYTNKTDTWAAGVLFWEMCYEEALFTVSTLQENADLVSSQTWMEILQRLPDSAQTQILRALLNPDPNLRLNSTEAIEMVEHLLPIERRPPQDPPSAGADTLNPLRDSGALLSILEGFPKLSAASPARAPTPPPANFCEEGACRRRSVFISHNWGLDEEGRENNPRVMKIESRLRDLGWNTWLDIRGDMQGQMDTAMSDGIDGASLVVVCVTRKYINKCRDPNDNCAKEFRYALQRKGVEKIVPVAMEPSVRDTKSWNGPVGLNLNNSLYVDATGLEDKLDQVINSLTEILERALFA